MSTAFKTLRPLVEDLYFVRLLGLAADVCVSRILLLLRERAGKGLKFSVNEAKRLEGDVAVVNKCFSEAKLLLHNGYVHNSLLSRQMQCLFDTCDLVLLAVDEGKDKDGNVSDLPSSSSTSSPLLALMRMLARKYNFLAASPLSPSSPPTETAADSTTSVAYNFLMSIAVLRPDASAATVSLVGKIVAQQRQQQRTKNSTKVISSPAVLQNKFENKESVSASAYAPPPSFNHTLITPPPCTHIPKTSAISALKRKKSKNQLSTQYEEEEEEEDEQEVTTCQTLL